MADRTIVYLHGFASSNQGEKARYLDEQLGDFEEHRFLAVNFNPTREDFRQMSITGMIHRFRQFVLDHDLDTPALIGSSLGGLVGLRYAASYPVKKILLLAPLLAYQSLSMSEEALEIWKTKGTIEIDHYAFPGKIPLDYQFHQDGLQYQDMVEPPGEVLIVHGRNDERVPIEDSRFYRERYPDQVRLVEVDSDHRLGDQLPLIRDLVRDYLIL